MMKSVDFETRECYRDRGSASSASLRVEMTTHLDAETALRCCQIIGVARGPRGPGPIGVAKGGPGLPQLKYHQ